LHVLQRRAIVAVWRRILVTGAIGLALIASVGIAAAAGQGAGADDPRFPALTTARIGGQTVRLVLTGTGVRTKYGLSVYTIGSYLQEGVKVRNAEELAAAPAPKLLHLIFERSLEGETVADSFRNAIGMNNPAPAFATELDQLDRAFRSCAVRRGDHVWLIAIPGTGLACHLTGQPVVLIDNAAFARAAWEVYLGQRSLDASIRMGLTSRL
jgi:hypothetical protein